MAAIQIHANFTKTHTRLPGLVPVSGHSINFELYLHDRRLETVAETVISSPCRSASDQYRLLITFSGVSGDFSQTNPPPVNQLQLAAALQSNSIMPSPALAHHTRPTVPHLPDT